MVILRIHHTSLSHKPTLKTVSIVLWRIWNLFHVKAIRMGLDPTTFVAKFATHRAMSSCTIHLCHEGWIGETRHNFHYVRTDELTEVEDNSNTCERATWCPRRLLMSYLCIKMGYPQPDVRVCRLFASLSSTGILHTYWVYWGKLSPHFGWQSLKIFSTQYKMWQKNILYIFRYFDLSYEK